MPVDLGVLLQFGLLAGVGYLMLRGGGCCGVPVRRPPAAERRPDPGPPLGGQPAQPVPDPLRALQVRLARGEIDVAEYRRLRAELAPGAPKEG